MAHSWLGKFVFVNFWLRPCLLLRVKYEDVVYNTFVAIALSTTENDEVLPELCRRVAVSR